MKFSLNSQSSGILLSFVGSLSSDNKGLPELTLFASFKSLLLLLSLLLPFEDEAATFAPTDAGFVMDSFLIIFAGGEPSLL